LVEGRLQHLAHHLAAIRHHQPAHHLEAIRLHQPALRLEATRPHHLILVQMVLLADQIVSRSVIHTQGFSCV
jgi:hypothetical protein